MPERIQMRRAKGWRKPANTVMITRPNRFANPFRVEDHGRDRALALYEEWITNPDAPPITTGKTIYRRPDPTDIAGMDVACACRLDEACHGDILLALANPTCDAALLDGDDDD